MKEEALDLALEALILKTGMNPVMQGSCYVMHPEALQAVIDEAIKQALAAPVQPVAWMTQARNFVHVMEFTEAEAKLYGWIPVYTTPLAQQAPNCTRSHPHESMDAMCELRTEIARLTNENARLKAQLAPVQEPVLKDNSNYRLDPPEAEPAQRQWVDPNDKTQEQYLPHIGEPVLFCHEGKTYMGKHTGGSFQSEVTNQYFNTWFCHWMYLPAAHGTKEKNT